MQTINKTLNLIAVSILIFSGAFSFAAEEVWKLNTEIKNLNGGPTLQIQRQFEIFEPTHQQPIKITIDYAFDPTRSIPSSAFQDLQVNVETYSDNLRVNIKLGDIYEAYLKDYFHALNELSLSEHQWGIVVDKNNFSALQTIAENYQAQLTERVKSSVLKEIDLEKKSYKATRKSKEISHWSLEMGLIGLESAYMTFQSLLVLTTFTLTATAPFFLNIIDNLDLHTMNFGLSYLLGHYYLNETKDAFKTIKQSLENISEGISLKKLHRWKLNVFDVLIGQELSDPGPLNHEIIESLASKEINKLIPRLVCSALFARPF